MSALILLALAAPVPKSSLPPLGDTNSNALVKRHRDKLALDASTQYQGWEATKAFDGDDATSWFTADNDTPTQGAKPWVKATFPAGVTVRRVSVRGNREPQWPGYTAAGVTVELLDAAGEVIEKKPLDPLKETADFVFTPARPVTGVRAVRVVVTKDDGTKPNVAVGEVQVE